MTPLEHFQQIFPSHRLYVEEGEIRYRFDTEQIGKIYERIAQKVILKNELRLTAVMEVWESEAWLVVKPVPDQYLVETL